MKWLFIMLIFPFNLVMAQGDSPYTKLLREVNEITIKDSLPLSTHNWQLSRLDSNDVKTWFSSLLGSAKNNRLKNRSYFLAGKITANPNYDLVFIIEEKKKTETSQVVVLHLFTRKKQGQYISSLEAAISGTKNQASYITSTVLYPDFSIRKHSLIVINEKELANKESYKINSMGRFILQDEN